MKTLFKHILFSCLLLLSITNFAQQEQTKGYWIDGDEIVFSFDEKDYEIAIHDQHGSVMDFDDLAIKNVIVSGNFNNWTRQGWQMEKVAEGQYELRKKIDAFTDEFTWEFKFIINNTYWAEPDDNFSNRTPAKSDDGFYFHAKNLKLYTAIPDKFGNTSFFLEGHQQAKKVILSGTFTRWDENFLKMKPVENGWKINLNLKPGVYEYKFIVDGQWLTDPANQDKTINEFGGFNSVIQVKKWVDFYLPGHTDASNVILSGSFNNWSENEYQMQKDSTGWYKKLYLTGGKHHYKFIIDGNWQLDPNNSVQEYDGEGNINCVKMVK